jgi:alanyl-tRNA synthetase
LGSWVWQHSAFKEDDHARLDITHHSPLSKEEISRIEDTANSIVQKNMSVTIENFDRGTAEQQYGFKIYQGGVVPVKSVRIVSIEDFDVEACGGTHVKKTGELDLIKITKTKRIQDGVVRLEFVSGPTAYEYVKKKEIEKANQKKLDVGKEQLEKQREERKQKAREMMPTLLEKISSGESGNFEGIQVKGKLCFTTSGQYDEFFHINFGKKLVNQEPTSAYCGIFEVGPTIRVIVYCGQDSGKKAGEIAREIAGILGGSGGGDTKFAQGGGKDTSKKEQAVAKAKSMILG